jgi:hypothetical protein
MRRCTSTLWATSKSVKNAIHLFLSRPHVYEFCVVDEFDAPLLQSNKPQIEYHVSVDGSVPDSAIVLTPASDAPWQSKPFSQAIKMLCQVVRDTIVLILRCFYAAGYLPDNTS